MNALTRTIPPSPLPPSHTDKRQPHQPAASLPPAEAALSPITQYQRQPTTPDKPYQQLRVSESSFVGIRAL
jgi:hypothetical protein